MKYQVLQLLGRGGQADVFLAKRDNELVVLKRLREDRATPEAAIRLRSEAEVLRAVDHPHLLRCLGVDVIDGADHVVLEWIDGVTLRHVLEAHPEGLDAELVAHIGAGLAGALTALHRVGIVHRDVAPENILLGRGGTVKLADAGMAKWIGVTPESRVGLAYGHDGYRAPEYELHGTLGPAADVYGLGVVLLELGRKGSSLSTEVRHAVAGVEERLPLEDLLALLRRRAPEEQVGRSGIVELVSGLAASQPPRRRAWLRMLLFAATFAVVVGVAGWTTFGPGLAESSTTAIHPAPVGSDDGLVLPPEAVPSPPPDASVGVLELPLGVATPELPPRRPRRERVDPPPPEPARPEPEAPPLPDLVEAVRQAGEQHVYVAPGGSATVTQNGDIHVH